MKRLLFGAITLALLGAGCAGGGESRNDRYEGTGVYISPEDPGPQPGYPGDDPAITVQGEWAGIAIALADDHNCALAKKYLTPAIQATFTDAECQDAINFFKIVPSIDWAKTETAEDKKTVTLHKYDGSVFAEYKIAENGAWYMNSKFWVK